MTVRGATLIGKSSGPDFKIVSAGGEEIRTREYGERPGKDSFRWVHCSDTTDLYVIGTEADERALHDRVHDKLGENHWATNPKKYQAVFAE